MTRLFTVVSTILTLLVVTTSANAALIRVSQESAAGNGDFDANVLGFIDPFNTGLTVANFYQYGSPNGASYNGELNGGPNPVSSLSQNFFVNGSDGLALVMVHDNPNDGTGGSTQTQWNLTGATAAQVLADDPGEAVTVSGGGTQFNSTKNWVGCCTDGYSIGYLGGDWELFGQFLTSPTGISNWAATSADFSTINLTLDPGRRVRFDVAIPEPSVIALFAAGLFGLGLAGRRKRS